MNETNQSTELAAIPPGELARVANNKNIINTSGDTVAMALRAYPSDQGDNLAWLFHWAKENHKGWDAIARDVGTSYTTLYRIWNGRYVNPSNGKLIDITELCDDIAKFRKICEARELMTRLPFIETSVWRRIEKICRETLEAQNIAFIYGEPQIGKTACLKEFCRRNNHGRTIYVLMPASGGVQAMMQAIADACHISSRSSFSQLRERVGNFLDGNKLLIMDEMHEVFCSYQKSSMLKCLAVLRQLQETTGCGMVLCGTNVFRREMEQGEFAQALKQLRKRGIWELALENSPSSEDLRKISDFYKLGGPTGEIAEAVRTISHGFGLGKYIKFIQRAAQLAKSKNQRFSWDHFARIVSIAAELQRAPKPENN
jgi:DNA transposition AAA+ family ATPase